MSPLPRPGQASCAEHAVLSQRIAKAINNFIAAKTEHARSIKEERDIRPYAAALREAKKKKNILAYALDTHRNQHGC